MIEKTCTTCVKWFDCKYRHGMYDKEIGVYMYCDNWTADERLDGRMAKCSDCGKIEPSKPSMPFFSYREDKEYDSFYCGCFGWD